MIVDFTPIKIKLDKIAHSHLRFVLKREEGFLNQIRQHFFYEGHGDYSYQTVDNETFEESDELIQSSFNVSYEEGKKLKLPEILRLVENLGVELAGKKKQLTIARAKRAGSNVLRATYEWLLGNRNKSINRIDLKYRDALQDYRLIDLRISDNANIAKIKKTSNLEVNGQGIDNTFQATRIGLSLLAEYLDADFFYRWTATRAALLLEEGDVVAITDNSSGVVNLPVMIEELNYDPKEGSIPRVGLTGRKYMTSLYDDSIADRKTPMVIEN